MAANSPQEAENGLRARTAKQDLVFGALQVRPGFLSAQDIHADLRAAGQKVGLATVYRVVQALQESGDVDVMRNESGELTYRSCESNSHHHHLVCRDCGRTVEVQGPAVEKWADSVAAQHGFSEVSHTVEIFGICADHRA